MNGLDDPAWVIEARDDVGVSEVKGSKHNQRVLQLWIDANLAHVQDDETAWCAAAVGAWLERAGVRSSRKPNALSYLDWGIDVFESGALAVPLGAILVKRRPGAEWQGHVTIAVGVTPDGLICGLGGNQKDRVGIDTFDPRVFIAARWPVEPETRDLKLLRRLPLLNIRSTPSIKEA